jgi:hypothetical protein
MVPSPPSKGLYLLPVIVGCYLLIYFFFGERDPFNGGLGFDGVFYGHFAQNFSAMLEQGIPEYYLDRILPSLVVWLGARISGAALSSDGSIVDGFHIYNSLLLVTASLAWVRLARVLSLTTPVAVVGAACLFLNWIVAKQYWYFVVQTDVTAFVAGVLLSLCVIERRLVSLTLIAVVTSFAFKTVMPAAMLLVLFPAPAPERRPARLEAWLPLAGAVIVVGITLYALFVEKIDVGSGGAKVDRSTLPLSLLALGAYVYYIADRTPVTRIAAGCRPHGFVVIGVFFGLWLARVALLAVMAAWFANTLDIMPLKSFMLGSFVVAVAKPAAFLVAHVVSFGPAFLLFLRYLRPLLDAAATHSAGAALFLVAGLALSVDSESRVLAFAYPLMVTFLCVVLQSTPAARSGRFALVFVAGAFVLSRCYLPLNALGMGALPHGPLNDISIILMFPSQWFMMMIGPYMGWPGYWTNLGFFIASAALVAALFPRLVGPSSPIQASPVTG